MLAVKHWQHYLNGRHFIIRTDQKSLKYLLDQKVSTPLQQKWLAKFMAFDYEIVYKQGTLNSAADAFYLELKVLHCFV